MTTKYEVVSRRGQYHVYVKGLAVRIATFAPGVGAPDRDALVNGPTSAISREAIFEAINTAFSVIRSQGIPRYAEPFVQALWNEISRRTDDLPRPTERELLQLLIGYHENQAAGAEAMGVDGSERYHDRQRNTYQKMLDKLSA